MYDEVGNDDSFGPSSGHDRCVFATEIQLATNWKFAVAKVRSLRNE